MRVSVAVVMAMVMVPKSGHANQIHQQAHGTNHKQLSQPLGFSALHHPLDRLEHNLHADQNQKHTVGETAQRLDLAEPVRESLARGPFASNSRNQTDCQGNTVEKHVDAVAQKTEGVGNITVKCLYRHVREVYRHKVEDAPRVLLCHDRVKQRVLGGIWEQKRSKLRPLSRMAMVRVRIPMQGGRSRRLKTVPLIKASRRGCDNRSSASG